MKEIRCLPISVKGTAVEFSALIFQGEMIFDGFIFYRTRVNRNEEEMVLKFLLGWSVHRVVNHSRMYWDLDRNTIHLQIEWYPWNRYHLSLLYNHFLRNQEVWCFDRWLSKSIDLLQYIAWWFFFFLVSLQLNAIDLISALCLDKEEEEMLYAFPFHCWKKREIASGQSEDDRGH